MTLSLSVHVGDDLTLRFVLDASVSLYVMFVCNVIGSGAYCLLLAVIVVLLFVWSRECIAMGVWAPVLFRLIRSPCIAFRTESRFILQSLS